MLTLQERILLFSVKPFLTIVQRAFLLASILHKKQERKASVIPGVPYLSHLMEVAGMLQANGAPDEVVAAGLLHDVLEDISASAAVIIQWYCGEVVLSYVKECTEIGTGDGGEFKADWKTRKVAYSHHITTLSVGGFFLSVSDKLQSGRELKRQVRVKGPAAYKFFAKRDYKTVQERKDATLWFHRELANAYKAKLETIEREALYLGVQALVLDFEELVDWLEVH